MFHFDVTCEDNRLIAEESAHPVGTAATHLDVRLIDNQSGKVHEIRAVSFCDVEKLISGMVCCHGEVAPEAYPHLEKLLEGCPNECRPIP